MVSREGRRDVCLSMCTFIVSAQVMQTDFYSDITSGVFGGTAMEGCFYLSLAGKSTSDTPAGFRQLHTRKFRGAVFLANHLYEEKCEIRKWQSMWLAMLS